MPNLRTTQVASSPICNSGWTNLLLYRRPTLKTGFEEPSKIPERGAIEEVAKSDPGHHPLHLDEHHFGSAPSMLPGSTNFLAQKAFPKSTDGI